MTELVFLVLLLAGGVAAVAVANSLMRVIIGAEVAIMAGIWGAALYVLANVVMVAPYYFRLMDQLPAGRSAVPLAAAVAVAALGAAAPLWLIYHVSSL